MGKRNSDRVPVAKRYGLGKTVGLMLVNHWAVISKCDRCGVQLNTNLKHIARLKGLDFTLWNARGRCKVVGCNGFVVFLARAPDMPWFEPLTIDQREPP